MSRELLAPIADISSVIPADLTVDTDNVLVRIKAGVYDILEQCGCKTCGSATEQSSVDSIVREKASALGLSRGIAAAVKDVAVGKGVDPASSPGLLASALTPQELESLMSYIRNTMTWDIVETLVPNQEMADIKTAELAKAHPITDPNWTKDINSIVNRIISHPVGSISPAGVSVVENIAVKLATLRPEVDRNGEICAWMYEES